MFSPWRRRIIVEQPSTLEILEEIKFPLIAAPFFGRRVIVKVQELTHAQILSIGAFSLIETFTDKVMRQEMGRRGSFSEVLEYAEKNHAICKETLVEPTYDEIFEAVGATPGLDEKKEELDRLSKMLEEAPVGRERRALEEQIDRLRVWIDLILPEDFVSWVVSYGLGINRSDIKKVTEEMLIQAAVLAEYGNDNPHDHIDGNFTAFNKADIDQRAWVLWSEQQKAHRRRVHEQMKAKGSKFAGWGDE